MVHLLRSLLLLRVLNLFSPIVFDVVFDSTQLDDVSSTQLVIEVVLCRFGVANHYEHLVVHILVWNRVALLVSGSLSHQSIVLNLE